MQMSWKDLNALLNEALGLEQDVRGTARRRQMDIVRMIRAGELDYDAPDACSHDAMTADMIIAEHGDAGRFYSSDMEDHLVLMNGICRHCPREAGCPCDRMARAVTAPGSHAD
ncbi:hypothetical protein sS8_2560 [Methylocaldum marinum]|uniref:Uncharacterized protein n=1 Tax=Methylocaldum marinum TaxID=1432792 RepID=A0A250KU79_9GAMM|nr:hypothetical protein [Methylocaldum marinum]BBA34511.1 hypothetical protein sS8_2560 [Methylocaldum marinum]